MSEDTVVRFGIYGKEALGMMKLNGMRSPYGLLSSDVTKNLTLAADGEVIYDSSISCPYYPTKYVNEDRRRDFRHKIGSALLYNVKNGFTNDDGSYLRWKNLTSPAKMRNSENADKPAGFDGIQKNVTLKQLALLIEILLGARDRKSIYKAYDEKTIKAVVGAPVDPMTSSALQVLIDNLHEIKKKMDDELKMLRIKQREEEDALKSQWNAKISEAEAQISSFRDEAQAV